MFLFGSGFMYGTPLQDANGNAIANPTPIKLGTMQNVSLDISSEIKELHGQLQFAVAVGRGKGKITGKASFAGWNCATLNNLFFGQTLGAGLVGVQNDVTGAVIPATPFVITPTVPSAGTFLYDLGVVDSNAVPMVRVASAPATGQYSLSAGAYTFAAADTGKTVFISYEYTATVAGAQKSTVINLAMGYAPTFRADLSFPFSGKQQTLSLVSCIASKVTISSKQDDFMIAEFDFSAFANAAGQVFTYSMNE